MKSPVLGLFYKDILENQTAHQATYIMVVD